MSTGLQALELHILRAQVRFHEFADQIHCATILFNASLIEAAIEGAARSLTDAIACIPSHPTAALDLAGYIRCISSLQAANHHSNQIDALLKSACLDREVSAIVHRALQHATQSIVDAYRVIHRNPARPQPKATGTPVRFISAVPPKTLPTSRLPTHPTLIKQIGNAIGDWVRHNFDGPCNPRPLPRLSLAPVLHSPSYQTYVSSDVREHIQASSRERR